MPYCTPKDILKVIKKSEYEKLTAGDDGVTEDSEIRDNAIADADSLINGYLRGVIKSLPLAAVPASIKQCSVDIAVFNLMARIQYDEIPQFWKDRYDARIAFLKDVSRGIVNLDQTVTDDQGSEDMDYTQEDRMFGRDTF